MPADAFGVPMSVLAVSVGAAVCPSAAALTHPPWPLNLPNHRYADKVDLVLITFGVAGSVLSGKLHCLGKEPSGMAGGHAR